MLNHAVKRVHFAHRKPFYLSSKPVTGNGPFSLILCNNAHFSHTPPKPSTMDTLWGIVSQKLEFHSWSSTWGNKSSVSGIGSQHLGLPLHHLPYRCVHDPDLLNSLEAAVKSALELIHVDEAFIADYENL